MTPSDFLSEFHNRSLTTHEANSSTAVFLGWVDWRDIFLPDLGIDHQMIAPLNIN